MDVVTWQAFVLVMTFAWFLLTLYLRPGFLRAFSAVQVAAHLLAFVALGVVRWNTLLTGNW